MDCRLIRPSGFVNTAASRRIYPRFLMRRGFHDGNPAPSTSFFKRPCQSPHRCFPKNQRCVIPNRDKESFRMPRRCRYSIDIR
jgi:hypothetical protein